MASSHNTTLKLVDIEASRKGWRLLPYFVGGVWLGEFRRDWMEKAAGKVVELIRSRFVQLGRPGVLDRVGWRPVKITADMVGTTIAQFVTVDAKTGGAKRLRPEQWNFARAVHEAGGFAGVAMRVEGAPGRVAIAEIGEE